MDTHTEHVGTNNNNNNEKAKIEVDSIKSNNSNNDDDMPTKRTSVEARLEQAEIAGGDSSKEHEGRGRGTRRFDIGLHIRFYWRRYKMFWCLGIWLLITGYFVAAVALRRKTKLSDTLPLIFIYVFISLKMLTAFTGTSFVFRLASHGGSRVLTNGIRRVPRRLRYAVAAVALLAIVLSVSLGLADSALGTRMERMHSLLGIVIILCVLTATSKHPRSIQWRTVLVGMLLQFCLGCIVTKTRWGLALFTWMANRAGDLLGFSSYGAKFLFGDDVGSMAFFAMAVFPAVIFFTALIQTVYYLGGMQWLLRNLGRSLQILFGVSGVEALTAAAAPFIGMTENMILIKDHIEHLTDSEIHACMTAGFATVSGSTLQAYLVLGVDPANLITACVMSIPCSMALTKIRYPETEEPVTRGRAVEPLRHTDEINVLHAIGNGAAVGINLVLLLAANLIAMISMVNLVDFFFTWFGQFIAIDDLTLELILSYVLYPYAWLLGVPTKDLLSVSKLLGIKFVINELVAYQRLGDSSGGPSIKSMLAPRSRAIVEYALCGFGNLGSIAIVIATSGALAPTRRADFSRLALSACVTGFIATTITAAIVAMVM
ncbi:hypothetical protein GGI11_004443 [Coemansia sp. RSA 2049]|nr:hypothetical protein GGI11_004443 [Coemansia sp. RSA 2049]